MTRKSSRPIGDKTNNVNPVQQAEEKKSKKKDRISKTLFKSLRPKRIHLLQSYLTDLEAQLEVFRLFSIDNNILLPLIDNFLKFVQQYQNELCVHD